jgi:hypothetical protein
MDINVRAYGGEVSNTTFLSPNACDFSDPVGTCDESDPLLVRTLGGGETLVDP